MTEVPSCKPPLSPRPLQCVVSRLLRTSEGPREGNNPIAHDASRLLQLPAAGGPIAANVFAAMPPLLQRFNVREDAKALPFGTIDVQSSTSLLLAAVMLGKGIPEPRRGGRAHCLDRTRTENSS